MIVLLLFIIIVVFALGHIDMMQLLGLLAIAALVLRTQKQQIPNTKQDIEHDASPEISFCGNATDESVKPIDVYDGRTDPEPALPQSSTSLPPESKDPYPWGSNPQYTGCYPEVPYDLGKCNTGAYLPFDEANARLAALRQRDKKCLDGVVTKNANYYKRHFSTELDEAEAKRWWGNQEY